MEPELFFWDGYAKRKAQQVICEDCGKKWLIRKDRKTPKFCKFCQVKGDRNPMYGKVPHNYINGNRRKETSLKGLKKTRSKRKAKIIQMMGDQCAHCGQKNLPICCYHMHHIDPETKVFSIMSKLNDPKLFKEDWALMKQEIEKCQLLCIHCHKIHHCGEARVEDF